MQMVDINVILEVRFLTDSQTSVSVSVVASGNAVVIGRYERTWRPAYRVLRPLVNSVKVFVRLSKRAEIVPGEVVAVLAIIVEIEGSAVLIHFNLPFCSVEGCAVVCFCLVHC